jgi:hypothetical protein
MSNVQSVWRPRTSLAEMLSKQGSIYWLGRHCDSEEQQPYGSAELHNGNVTEPSITGMPRRYGS